MKKKIISLQFSHISLFILLNTIILIIFSDEIKELNYDYNLQPEQISIIHQGKQNLIPEKILNMAYLSESDLNSSIFFNTEFIIDYEKVQREFLKDPTFREILVQTEDNKQLTCSFFDRKKKRIIVIAPGFTNPSQKMAPFVHLFNNHTCNENEGYDILIMNFRGHGYKKGNINPIYNALEVNSEVRLGAIEERDVFAVIKNLKNLKKYKEIIGLGVCFGAFAFAKAQGLAEKNNSKCFDKLILDGCPLSMESFVKKIEADPYLIISPQKGGATPEVKWLFSHEFLQRFIENQLQKILNIKLSEIKINQYLPYISIPTLLFYGKDDLTITRDEFEEIVGSINQKNLLSIITTNAHVLNHIASKEIYKTICELFIEYSIEDTKELLLNPTAFKKFVCTKFSNQLSDQPIVFRPMKLEPEKETFFTQLFSYKWHALTCAMLWISYKNDNINSSTIVKVGSIYAIFKIIESGWRPMIRWYIGI